MKKFLTLLIFVSTVFACKNDDGPVSRNIFKISMDADVNMYDLQAWIIIRTSKDGELIDYKPITPGSSLVFETDKVIPDNLIDVTYFTFGSYVNDAGTNNGSHCNIYTQVDVGTELSVVSPAPITDVSKDAGTFDLDVSYVPQYYSMAMGDRYGESVSHSESEGYIRGPIRLRANASTYLISIGEANKNPKYTILENVKPNDSYELNYYDFKEFDKIIPVTFPKPTAVFAQVSGRDGNTTSSGFRLFNTNAYAVGAADWSFNLPQTGLKLGFLDRFSIYDIEISSSEFYYKSSGPMPSSIEYQDNSKFTVTNKTLSGFAVNASAPYVKKTITFYYSGDPQTAPTRNFVTLNYFSGIKDVACHQPIPDELLSQFSIPVDKVELSSVEFFIKGESYKDFLLRSKHFDGRTSGPDAPFIDTRVYAAIKP